MAEHLPGMCKGLVQALLPQKRKKQKFTVGSLVLFWMFPSDRPGKQPLPVITVFQTGIRAGWSWMAKGGSFAPAGTGVISHMWLLTQGF